MPRNLARDLAQGRPPAPDAATPASLRLRDERLYALVLAYRLEGKGRAAPLLDFLAPAMVSRLGHYRDVPPGLGADDLSQQMVVEVLRAALTIPLPRGAEFLERRIILRAGQAMRRMLEREQRHRRRVRTGDEER